MAGVRVALANEYILCRLFQEMAREQLTGGAKEGDFSNTSKETAESFINTIKQQLNDDPVGMFKEMYEKSLTVQ